MMAYKRINSCHTTFPKSCFDFNPHIMYLPLSTCLFYFTWSLPKIWVPTNHQLLDQTFHYEPFSYWGTLQELAEPNLNPHPSSQEASNRVTTANLTCRIWPTDMKSLGSFYGFHGHGGTLIAGWFIMENPKITWVI